MGRKSFRQIFMSFVVRTDEGEFSVDDGEEKKIVEALNSLIEIISVMPITVFSNLL